MKSDEPLRLNTNELPRLLELVGPNGETIPYELMPTKGRIGMFLNKVSKPLRKFISGRL